MACRADGYRLPRLYGPKWNLGSLARFLLSEPGPLSARSSVGHVFKVVEGQ